MILLVIIPVALVCALVGFVCGVRYCASRMLPAILARLPQRKLTEVVAKASELRKYDEVQ